jgi:hypothetical protein
VMHRGIGHERASQLAAAGVHRVEDLQRWTADDMASRLRTGDARDRFLERRVRAWQAVGRRCSFAEQRRLDAPGPPSRLSPAWVK